MKQNYFIFTSGLLKRKDNTVYFEPAEPAQAVHTPETATPETTTPPEPDEILIDADAVAPPAAEETVRLTRKPIPVENIESFYCFGEHRFNSRFFVFLAKPGIPLHLFNYYGYYSGSFYPKETLVSGKLLVQQVNHYNQPEERLRLAARFVSGAAENMLKNLKYYNKRERDMVPFITLIEGLLPAIEQATTIAELMGIEGQIRKYYYESWHLIISDPIDFSKRQRRPPPNPVNALISFGNGIIYAAVLSSIYQTQLNPTVSFLHEPGERRFSLALDISEIFKPLFVDRSIFSVLNKKIIQDKHFTIAEGMCYLNDEGKKLFVKEIDDKLKTTIQHRGLKRSVSYQTLIRLECYKIIKHLLGDKPYEPFTIWW